MSVLACKNVSCCCSVHCFLTNVLFVQLVSFLELFVNGLCVRSFHVYSTLCSMIVIERHVMTERSSNVEFSVPRLFYNM